MKVKPPLLLAIVIAAGTILPVPITNAITNHSAVAANNAEASNPLEPDPPSELSIVNSLAIIVSLIGAIGGITALLNYVVKLTNTISDLRSSLKDELLAGFTELNKQSVANREELLRTQSQIKLGGLEAARSVENVNKDLVILQKDFVLMQKEVQKLLTILDKRIMHMETALRSSNIKLPVEPSILMDIESI